MRKVPAHPPVLGEKILEDERALDRAFASGTPAESEIRALLEEIADHRARLRLAHLRAHLATTEVLTRHQIHEYARLRGYGAHEGHGEGHAP